MDLIQAQLPDENLQGYFHIYCAPHEIVMIALKRRETVFSINLAAATADCHENELDASCGFQAIDQRGRNFSCLRQAARFFKGFDGVARFRPHSAVRRSDLIAEL